MLKIFLKILAASNSISEETKRSLRPVGTRPGIIYELDKFHNEIKNYPPFWLIPPIINPLTCKLEKF